MSLPVNLELLTIYAEITKSFERKYSEDEHNFVFPHEHEDNILYLVIFICFFFFYGKSDEAQCVCECLQLRSSRCHYMNNDRPHAAHINNIAWNTFKIHTSCVVMSSWCVDKLLDTLIQYRTSRQTNHSSKNSVLRFLYLSSSSLSNTITIVHTERKCNTVRAPSCILCFERVGACLYAVVCVRVSDKQTRL